MTHVSYVVRMGWAIDQREQSVGNPKDARNDSSTPMKKMAER